jgi:CRP/FNR family transcriptional regulator
MRAATLELEETVCPTLCEACDARGVSICRVLPHPQLRRLAAPAAIGDYAIGETLLFEGDPAAHVLNITEGAVMLSKGLADGRRQVLGFLFKGDFLGLTLTETYGLSAQALTPAKACRFPRASFQRLLRETPRLEEELLSRASDELVSARLHLTLLGRKSATERVATFLGCMADRTATLGGQPGTAHLPMTRADIADYLGLTTETVSRVISALKRQRTIGQAGRGLVRILDAQRLEALAERA